MRILWVKAGKLLPVDTGGKIRSYNLLRQLAMRHEVTLLSYYGGRRDQTYERELREHFSGAETIHTSTPHTSLGEGLRYLRRLPARAPYAVTKFTSPVVQERVGKWLSELRFDAAVCDFLSASLNFPRLLPTPSVLFQHNVESALWERQARHEPNPLKSLAFRLEAAKMNAYERAAVRRFHHVIAVSEHDRNLMSKFTDPARISVVPTGVDLRQYRVAPETKPNGKPDRLGKDPLVVFLGSMDWEANIDGVDWFCRDIWPAVLAEVPDARFRVVGRNPHARVRRLASANVEVTGTVPSVREHLEEAAVFVVPLRVGGGTRLKIFEAMAVGRAVVSTTVGAEGLDVTDGRDVILADDSRLFAEGVVSLLRDVDRRHQFERLAVELAARHDWSMVVRSFEEALERATRVSLAERDGSTESIPARA